MMRLLRRRRTGLRATPASSRSVRSADLIVLLLLTACAGARSIPVTAPVTGVASTTSQRVVSSATGQTITFAQMADAAAKADVVFFGEQHDDDETHRAELALLSAIGERRRAVILSLEMFERDVQPVLDTYLAGRIGEEEFLAQSRPWPNYATDYRPLVELAKAKGWPVIASNVPRRLASTVSRRGLPAVDSLPVVDRGFVARDMQCPKDRYYENFMAVMGGAHGGATAPSAPGARPMMDLFYEAQCVKDETMAESIVQARATAPGAIVVHVTGAFHSDFGLGTVSRLSRRLPSARTAVVSAVPTRDPLKEKAAEHLARGQFVILALRNKP